MKEKSKIIASKTLFSKLSAKEAASNSARTGLSKQSRPNYPIPESELIWLLWSSQYTLLLLIYLIENCNIGTEGVLRKFILTLFRLACRSVISTVKIISFINIYTCIFIYKNMYFNLNEKCGCFALLFPYPTLFWSENREFKFHSTLT